MYKKLAISLRYCEFDFVSKLPKLFAKLIEKKFGSLIRFSYPDSG